MKKLLIPTLLLSLVATDSFGMLATKEQVKKGHRKAMSAITYSANTM